MSSDKNRLLGKKREVRSDDENQEDEFPHKKVKKIESQEQKKENEDEDSSNSDHKPTQTLFGNTNETGFKIGLFGDLSNQSLKPESLLGNDSNKTQSIFNNNGGSLVNQNIFCQNNVLFNFSEMNKKNNSDSEDDEQIGKSNSPNPYDPIKNKTGSNSAFNKTYVKLVEYFYLFDKESNTYNSKGKGYISIELFEEEEKKYALIMFRNMIGSVLFEGVLNEKYNKFNSYVKKFKHVAQFYFLTKLKDKVEGNNAKIPFMNEEEVKHFELKYISAIDFLKGVAGPKKEDEKKE